MNRPVWTFCVKNLDVNLGNVMQAITRRHRLEVAFRYWWYRLKLLLRQNVNVDKNFFAADAAVRLTDGILPKGTRITCSGRTDGVGMQALARMSGIHFAHAFGATYVDTPFKRVSKAPGEMSEWIESWEKLFNFGKGEERINNGDYRIVEYPDYLSGKAKLDQNSVIRFQQCYWISRRYPDAFKEISPSLQEKFGLPQTRAAGDAVVVAIHVRRGDVGSNTNALRFTPNKKILKTIECLRQVSKSQGTSFRIEIFSQGEPADFTEFSDAGCHLNLDTDAVWTMRKLVEADVLVMAKSSFSYAAALINRGVKIYEPTFNPPLSHWIIKRRDGSFDETLAALRLREYLGSLGAEKPADAADRIKGVASAAE